VNGDGLLDVIVGANDNRVYAWSTPAPYDADRIAWGTFRHDARRTGEHGDGTARIARPSVRIAGIRVLPPTEAETPTAGLRLAIDFEPTGDGGEHALSYRVAAEYPDGQGPNAVAGVVEAGAAVTREVKVGPLSAAAPSIVVRASITHVGDDPVASAGVTKRIGFHAAMNASGTVYEFGTDNFDRFADSELTWSKDVGRLRGERLRRGPYCGVSCACGRGVAWAWLRDRRDEQSVLRGRNHEARRPSADVHR